MGLNRSSVLKVITICIFYELPFSITSVSIYYGTQSDIRVNSYYCFAFFTSFHFQFRASRYITGLNRKFEFKFAQIFYIQFRVSWYITGLNRTSEEKFIVNWICPELLFSISSVLIYDETQLDIHVKSYCYLNLLRVSVFNFASLDILQDSIGLSSKNLLSFEFSQSFCFQFRASRIIKGLNWTFL